MNIRKTGLLLLLLLPASLTAQMRDGTYQSQKTGRENTVEIISVEVVPLGNGVMHFHEGNPRNPLVGTYRITVNRREYHNGSFKKGIPDGYWERYYDDRLWEKSFYRNGRLEGKFARYRQNGEEEYVLTYQNGLKQHYLSYHPGGRTHEEQFYDENGRLHGEMFSYNADGTVEEEKRYVHGQRQGIQVETDRNGYKVSQEYVDNKRQGVYTKTYPNGSPFEKGAYDANGEKTGKWTAWNEDGSLKSEEHYLNNQLDGEKRTYYADGKLKSTEAYAAGKLDGQKTEYDEDPHRVSREVMYAADRLHGAFRVWHDGILWREGAYQNGALIYEKEFADGKLQIVKLLDENGALIPVEKYDNTGRRTFRNTNYRKHSDVVLKESTSGVLDVEIK